MPEIFASSDNKICRLASEDNQGNLLLVPRAHGRGHLGCNAREQGTTVQENFLADGSSSILRQTASRPVMLASFSVPARWQLARSESDRAAVERQFGNELEMAIGTLLAQLPVGAALTVDYVLTPAAGGAVHMRVVSGLKCLRACRWTCSRKF